MKKKLFATAAVALIASLAVGGTLAYYTADDTAHNVITSGGVQIKLVEKSLQDGVLVDFPKEGISNVMPGTTVSKIVRVENTGASEAWVRVKLTCSLVSSDGDDLPAELQDGTPVMAIDALDGWTKGDDGYFYCNAPVAAGAQTLPLIREVAFSTLMGNEYQNSTANIVVAAQAVQTANNGATVMDAQGWPAE